MLGLNFRVFLFNPSGPVNDHVGPVNGLEGIFPIIKHHKITGGCLILGNAPGSFIISQVKQADIVRGRLCHQRFIFGI